MAEAKIRFKWLICPFFAAMALVALFPMFSVVWPLTHDRFRYLSLSHAFNEALFSGILYPRWLPDLCCGYGYPTFVFYQPGIYYLAGACSLVSGDLITAYQLALFLLFFQSFIGVYLLAGEFTEDFAARVFAVILFCLTPYLYVNLYVRGALSELAVMLLTPWPLVLLFQIQKNKRSFKSAAYAFLAALALAVMVYTHPFPCVIFFPFFLVFAASMIWHEEGGRDFFVLKMAVLAVVGAVAMSSPFWLNALLMKRFIHAERALSGYYRPELHCVYPSQLFSCFWGFGDSVVGKEDGMAFQLGLVHFLISVAGAIIGYRNRKVLVSFACYLVLILLMLPFAASFWIHSPVLPLLQFPWRLLSVAAILQVICSLGLWEMKITRRARCLAYGALTLLCLIWYRHIFSVQPTPESELKQIPEYTEYSRRHFITGTSDNEFMPVTAKKTLPRGEMPLIQSSHEHCRLYPAPGSDKFHLRYIADVEKPAIIRINQYYFPGWRVEVNGVRIEDHVLEGNISDNGLMLLMLDSGPGQSLEACYEGPMAWRWINFIAFTPVLAFLLGLSLALRRGICAKRACRPKD
ncbi:MAG: hypothetical protein JW808_01505 [Victivallales bacterium]|nr:hypothetical protein [Victivallales bacterium]